MGTYATVLAPASLRAGRFLQPESKVLLNPTLETSSFLYAAYGANIGNLPNTGIEFATITQLSFQNIPTYQEIETVSFRSMVGMFITGEEVTVRVGVQEFSPEILHAAMGNGVLMLFVGGKEALITFGGKCDITPMPMVIHFNNVACELPTVADVRNGITGGILTLYKVISISGLNMDAITAKDTVKPVVEFRALADTTKAVGNRIGNLYLY